MAEAIGRCDVSFSISKEGMPHSIQAMCDLEVFCDSATQAVANARFFPAIRNGEAAEQQDVVYPIDYMMDGSEAPKDKDLKACEALSSQ